VYHQHLQQQQQKQQQYQQYQQRLQQQQQQLQQERLLYETSPKVSPSSHAARDYDIKRKLSAKQRERREEPNNGSSKLKPQSSLTGSPGTVKQRVKERKHTMKDAEVIAKLRTICTEADPSLVYKNMRKIGQG
jgi:p21-activated kinase 1